jgi:hypothetical protein
VRRLALVLATLSLSAGCGKGEAPAPASAAASASAGAAVAGTGKPLCPRTGHWTECLAFARLEQAGVAPRRDSVLDGLPKLGVPPHIYLIGRNGVAVYLFADTLARARAARGLDTLHFIAPSAALTMRGETTVIQNDNLLALLFSRIDQQRERVSDAFMAGAPQP